MAYTAVINDEVFVITSDGTGGGFTYGTGRPEDTLSLRLIRWVPNGATDVATLSSFRENGSTAQVVWADEADSLGGRESYVQPLKLQRGFNIVMPTGSVAYLYFSQAGLRA